MRSIFALWAVLGALWAIGPAAGQAPLASEADLAQTKAELFGVWQLAKERLSLSNALDPLASLKRALGAGPAGDDRALFAQGDLKGLKRMVRARLAEPELARLEPPKHSARAWGGWYDQGDGLPALSRRQVRAMACGLEEQPALDSEALLRAAETLLFDFELDDPLCDGLRGKDPMGLLKQAASLNQGDASVKARTLLLALELIELSKQDDSVNLDAIDSPKPEPWNEKMTQTVKELLSIAFETNYPLAHIMLAKLYAEQDECDRASSHALSALVSTEALVQNLMMGSLRKVEDRASRLHASGDLDDESLFRTGFSSVEDFFEQEMHLQELARSLAEEEGVHDEGHLDVRLGDLYYFGAPEVGIPPQIENAERMYRRALEFGNGAAASQLAAMTLNDEIIDDEDDNEISRNSTAFELYKRASELGDALGLVGLGLFYEQATAPQVGGVPNKRKAAELYAQAAERGLSEGDYRLGRLHLFDFEMLNTTKGYHHFERAAERGHVGANYELGFSLFFSDFSVGSCERALKYLTRALRSDWTWQLPFDLNRGLRALSLRTDRDDIAFRIFMMSHVTLWQEFALVNAAYVMEHGFLAELDSEPVYFSENLSLIGLEQSIFRYLGPRFRWPTHWRVDASAIRRNKLALRLYARAARSREKDEGEAWRKIAECLMEKWNGACDSSGKTPTNDIKARAIYYIRKAVEYGDGEASWIMARYKAVGLDGLVARNFTAGMEELDHADDLDPNAWFLVEMTRIILHVRSWFG